MKETILISYTSGIYSNWLLYCESKETKSLIRNIMVRYLVKTFSSHEEIELLQDSRFYSLFPKVQCIELYYKAKLLDILYYLAIDGVDCKRFIFRMDFAPTGIEKQKLQQYGVESTPGLEEIQLDLNLYSSRLIRVK